MSEKEEKDEDFVSSFLYDSHVNSFPIGNGQIGLQFSSYYILPEGSINLGIGRDVFLVFNPADDSLHPGLIDLGVTKERDWESGCFHALMHHFVIGDANGDGLMDIGIVKEEIRCPGEDDDWYGAQYVQHSMRWYVFSPDGWKRGGALDAERCHELPLIGMSSSPVEFAAIINWHTYDPAGWTPSAVFKPSYRARLIAKEIQTRRSSRSRKPLIPMIPKLEHPTTTQKAGPP